MSSIPANKIIVFIGKRGVGKSKLVLDYLYHHQDFPTGTVISPTDEYNWTYKPHVPSMFIFENYSPALIEQVLSRQKKICKRVKSDPNYAGVDPRSFLVMDDCLASAKNWVNDENIRFIFMNGRHTKLTLIITMQDPLGIPNFLRNNVDYIFICKDPKRSNQERIWKHWAGIFPHFNLFRDVLRQCTTNYGCMVIDNTSISDRIDDQVFWYRAQIDREGFDTFKLCYPMYWKNNDQYLTQEEDHHTKSEISMANLYQNLKENKNTTYLINKLDSGET